MTLTGRQVRELLARHGAAPTKARGQNFVVDPNTVRRVARLAGVGPGDRVVEVGAGVGSLTLALAETGAAVTAIEVDGRLVAALREVVEPVGVTVVEADAMRVDWADLLGGGGGDGDSWTLVANLPYNIATPLLADLLDEVPQIRRFVVMVQREVAERLAASAGDEAYGAVSVKVAYWAEAKVVGRVPPTVFVPQPRVDSVLVRLHRLPAPPVDADPERLFRLVEAGFGQRRKML
ncbi:MAG: 16S rRNA (adenine(1518)-N(6)/adenine(1519)-N(6))-dimethyltransferase RsmA, partial [Acidimicrobiales bacterium]